MADWIVDACVKISGQNPGSGVIFWVNQGTALVVTNSHVLPREDGRAVAITKDGWRHEGKILRSSPAVDLCVFAIAADANTSWVPLANRHPQSGEKIWQVGFPAVAGQQVFTRRHGVSQGLNGKEGIADQVQLSFPLIGGDSGSPVFNEAGEVCAIAHATTPSNGKAIPVEWVREILERYCQAYCPPGGWGQPQPWRPGPQQPGPQQPPPPLNPPRPGPSPEVEAVKKNIEELKQLLQNLKPERGPQGSQGPQGVPGVQGTPGPAGPEGGAGLAERLKGRVDQHEERLGRLPVLEGLVTLAPWLIGGSLLGGATPLVLLGLKGLRVLRTVRRVRKSRRQASSDSEPQVILRDVPGPVIPPVVHEKSIYVSVPEPSEELAGLKRAMDRLARDFPGTVGTIETLKAMGQQCMDPRKIGR